MRRDKMTMYDNERERKTKHWLRVQQVAGGDAVDSKYVK